MPIARAMISVVLTVPPEDARNRMNQGTLWVRKTELGVLRDRLVRESVTPTATRAFQNVFTLMYAYMDYVMCHKSTYHHSYGRSVNHESK